MAVGASATAVAAIVRDAVRDSSATPQVDGERLGLQRERRDGPESRHLRALARLCLQRPELVSDETALKLLEILPEGSWKAIILQIIEAAAEGLLVAGGESGVDPFAIEPRLDEDSVSRLREIAVDDTPIDTERSADQILDEVIGWFEKHRRAAREQEINRRLRDPNEDHGALLAERDSLLLERRARIDRNSGNTSRAPKDTHPESANS